MTIPKTGAITITHIFIIDKLIVREHSKTFHVIIIIIKIIMMHTFVPS